MIFLCPRGLFLLTALAIEFSVWRPRCPSTFCSRPASDLHFCRFVFPTPRNAVSRPPRVVPSVGTWHLSAIRFSNRLLPLPLPFPYSVSLPHPALWATSVPRLLLTAHVLFRASISGDRFSVSNPDCWRDLSLSPEPLSPRGFGDRVLRLEASLSVDILFSSTLRSALSAIRFPTPQDGVVHPRRVVRSVGAWHLSVLRFSDRLLPLALPLVCSVSLSHPSLWATSASSGILTHPVPYRLIGH